MGSPKHILVAGLKLFLHCSMATASLPPKQAKVLGYVDGQGQPISDPGLSAPVVETVVQPAAVAQPTSYAYGVAQPALQPIQYGTTTTFLAPSPSTTTMLPAVMPAPTPIVKTYTTTVR